jgi:DNA-binding response OmpR family regulator
MSAERLRILAVEDEGLIAMELEDLLGDLGHEVIGPAATVESALTLLEGARPDAAVVDANLGGESARPVVEALQAGGIPVVLASGYEPQDLETLGLGVPLLRKPYSRRELADALETVRRAATSPS